MHIYILYEQQKEKEKYEKLLALPSVEQSLSDRYSKFDAVTGYPTHDKDGNELEGKVRNKCFSVTRLND
jgi:cysteinyl-tRNA synthetase